MDFIFWHSHMYLLRSHLYCLENDDAIDEFHRCTGSYSHERA